MTQVTGLMTGRSETAVLRQTRLLARCVARSGAGCDNMQPHQKKPLLTQKPTKSTYGEKKKWFLRLMFHSCVWCRLTVAKQKVRSCSLKCTGVCVVSGPHSSRVAKVWSARVLRQCNLVAIGGPLYGQYRLIVMSIWNKINFLLAIVLYVTSLLTLVNFLICCL